MAAERHHGAWEDCSADTGNLLSVLEAERLWTADGKGQGMRWDRWVTQGPHQPLTPPAVRPAMMFRWKIPNSAMVGMEARKSPPTSALSGMEVAAVLTP